MTVKKTPPMVRPIAKGLAHWFQENARDLPWRKDRDLFSVWISEIMLQQTQVTTMLPYYEKFLKRFPTVDILAGASLDQVYELWAGLGYYSRARNLHRGAQAIVARLKEKKGFPANRNEWLEIPGVGEYTAGAICSIAMNQREALVDGNVVRVLSRLYGIKKLDSKRSEIWALAKHLVLVKEAEPRILNQALMELGSLVCRPKNPQCLTCPVQKSCRGKKAPLLYPAPKPKVKWKQVQEKKWILFAGLTQRDWKIFLEQNSKGEWREGLWDFLDAGQSRTLKRGKFLGEFILKYTVTTHKISRSHGVFQVPISSKAELPRLTSQGRWFSVSKLPGVPAPVKKAILRSQRVISLSVSSV